jgi:hypothetical protein
MIENATKDDLLLPILQKLVETQERIEQHQKAQFALIQEQLRMMEQQLNTTTIWASRAYNSSLDPKAREAAMEESKKLAEEHAKQVAEEEEALLKSRANAGVPDGGNAVTEEDERWWRDDSDR